MSNRSCVLSRGDRRRNDRLAGLRGVVTRESAVVAFDLACDKQVCVCLLYTSDAADERSSVDLGGRRIIKKKNSGAQGDRSTLDTH